ncbi:MAG: bll2198; hypothetical protein, partial [uncultured Pseudonocardia sp.]
ARAGPRLRHARPRDRRRAAPVLGRVGALHVLDGRGALAGGRRRGAARDVPQRRRPGGHHRAVPRLRHPRARLGGGGGVVAAQRPARLRALRPALRRVGPGEAAGVQRRHPHHAAGGVAAAVVLAQGRPPRRRPVELPAREARGALGWDQGPAARQRAALHLVGRRHLRRGPRHRRLPAGDRRGGRVRHRRPGHRGHRLGRPAGPVRRPRGVGDGGGVQALPVGVGRQRRLRQARAAQPARDPVDRAAVEDDPVQQGDPRGAVGDVPGPPQPAARPPRPARPAHRVRPQAPPRPRGRQHHRRRCRLGGRDGRCVRRGGFRLPAPRPAPRVRRLPARAGRLGRRRHGGRPRHPRDGRSGDRRRRGVRPPPHPHL